MYTFAKDSLLQYIYIPLSKTLNVFSKTSSKSIGILLNFWFNLRCCFFLYLSESVGALISERAIGSVALNTNFGNIWPRGVVWVYIVILLEGRLVHTAMVLHNYIVSLVWLVASELCVCKQILQSTGKRLGTGNRLADDVSIALNNTACSLGIEFRYLAVRCVTEAPLHPSISKEEEIVLWISRLSFLGRCLRSCFPGVVAAKGRWRTMEGGCPGRAGRLLCVAPVTPYISAVSVVCISSGVCVVAVAEVSAVGEVAAKAFSGASIGVEGWKVCVVAESESCA